MPDTVWLDYDQSALDRQYNQRVLVPDADDYMARHGVISAEVRRRLACRLDVAYGPSPDEVLDIFPVGDGAPVVVYFHGGAWTRWHKDNNSYQAVPFTERGVTFVSVNFALVPTVTLDELIRQCRAAVAWVWRNARDFGADPDRLFVAGHSSGGHEVGMLTVTDWRREWDVPADIIKGAVAASGMYELEPVRLSSRNEYLHLDDGAVDRNSPLRHLPACMPPMIIAYGEGEQTEFRRHSSEFAAELRRRGHQVTELDLPGLNHFQVAEEFGNPDGALLGAVFELIGV